MYKSKTIDAQHKVWITIQAVTNYRYRYLMYICSRIGFKLKVRERRSLLVLRFDYLNVSKDYRIVLIGQHIADTQSSEDAWSHTQNLEQERGNTQNVYINFV